jgi:hypothetical protein
VTEAVVVLVERVHDDVQVGVGVGVGSSNDGVQPYAGVRPAVRVVVRIVVRAIRLVAIAWLLSTVSLTFVARSLRLSLARGHVPSCGAAGGRNVSSLLRLSFRE